MIIPIVIVLSIVGSFTINNNVADIYWMIAFGILGYFLKMYDYPLAPMVLGVILSPLIDANYRRAMALEHGDIGSFLAGFVTNPLTAVLLLFMVFMLLNQVDWKTKLGALRQRFSK